jgi:uncharacterized membrane protein
MIDTLKRHKWMIAITGLFVMVYALISLVNHYQFRTYALDLGAYSNALYDYRSGHFNDSTVFKSVPENLLADHLDLYLILISPLSYLFGSWTLLIVQIVALCFGAWGVYLYFRNLENARHLSIWSAIYFYSFFGIYGALSFDYHSNVVASCFVPWMFYAARRGQLMKMIIWYFVILIAKENMALWLTFLCLGLAIEHWSNARIRWVLLGGMFFSAFCFIGITGFLMPAFSNGGKFNHFKYSVFGNGFGDAIRFVIQHPIRTIEVMFTNHLKDSAGDGIKMELHILLMLSGILLLFRRPAYLLMLVPIFFQKLFHDSLNLWGIGSHYCMEFIPVMAIGIFEIINRLRHQFHERLLAILVVFGSFYATQRMIDRTANYWEMPRLQFYKPWHYEREYDVVAVHKALQDLPACAVVSTQSAFLPHLAIRDKVYEFPLINDAEYVVLSKFESPYPLTKDAYDELVTSLCASGSWIVERDDVILLLHRR